jgi:UPF0271 protein
MPGTATARAAETFGLRPIYEIYADRTYSDTFNLSPRNQKGSVIHDPADILERVMRMLSEQRLTSTGGKTLAVPIDSICLHGDAPGAVERARVLRQGLEVAGWTIAPAIRP